MERVGGGGLGVFGVQRNKQYKISPKSAHYGHGLPDLSEKSIFCLWFLNASGGRTCLTLLFIPRMISQRSRRVCSHVVGANHLDFPQVCVMRGWAYPFFPLSPWFVLMAAFFGIVVLL